MSRAKTKEEVKKEFLLHIKTIVKYWSDLPDITAIERCDGVAFSILNIIDGTSMALPAMNISTQPHSDDKAYFIQNDENWYEPGMVINDDTMLHDEWVMM